MALLRRLSLAELQQSVLVVYFNIWHVALGMALPHGAWTFDQYVASAQQLYLTTIVSSPDTSTLGIANMNLCTRTFKRSASSTGYLMVHIETSTTCSIPSPFQIGTIVQ